MAADRPLALGGRAPVAAHEDVLAGDGRLHKEAEEKVLAHGERHQAHLRAGRWCVELESETYNRSVGGCGGQGAPAR